MFNHGRTIFRQLAAIGFVLLLTAGLFVAYFEANLLQHACEWTGTTQTEYAPGYTERQFRRVSVGDTQEEVIERLGQPLTQFTPAEAEGFSWVYTASVENNYYWHRAIAFDTSGRVVGRESELVL